MLKTILNKLNLISKKESEVYINKCASLSKKVNILEQQISTLKQVKSNWAKIAQSTTTEANQVNLEIKHLKQELQDSNDEHIRQINAILKQNKELKRSVNRLLKKQHSYKAQIKAIALDKVNLSLSLSQTKEECQSLSDELIEYIELGNPEEIKQTLKKLSLRATFWEEYSNKVIERLETLCFGSLLPKAMKPAILKNYQHLIKLVDISYFKDKQGQIWVSAEHE